MYSFFPLRAARSLGRRHGGIREQKCKLSRMPIRSARALRLLRVHPLRAADALQLSACLDACDRDPSALAFVCAGERLCEAAEKEGLRVLR